MKDIDRKGDTSSRKRKLATDDWTTHLRTSMTTGNRHKENGSADPSPSRAAKKPKENGSAVKANTIKFHDWEQSNTDVTITLSAGKQLKAKDVDATFSELICKVSLSDGRVYTCQMYDAVVPPQCRIQCKGTRIIIRMKKKDTANWEKLEMTAQERARKEKEAKQRTTAHGQKKPASPPTSSKQRPGIPPPPTPATNGAGDGADLPITHPPPPPPPPPPPLPPPPPTPPTPQQAGIQAETGEETQETEENLFPLNFVKNDFFEKSTVGAQDTCVIHLYLKEGKNVSVQFTSISLCIKFQTTDPKFHSVYGGNDDSVYCWKFNTFDRIDPNKCRFQQSSCMIVITLRKMLPRRWGAFTELKGPETEETRNWINKSNQRLESTYNNKKNSTTVAFDELAEERSRMGNESNKLISSTASTSSSSSLTKPTCKVSPSPIKSSGAGSFESAAVVVTPGFTGLDNLGNTCFMNSILQVLANTYPLRDYFFSGKFQKELNRTNPLGTGGQLAVAFATLMKILWSGKRTSYAPLNLKKLISLKASQFAGNAQHDAQELLAFLLDGLHEDLNRVLDKPYTTQVESAGKPDHEVAAQAWAIHKQRNDSLIVDMFQGQYKSTLVCPVCQKVSITFDPFMHLSVPLPKKLRNMTVIFMSKDPHRTPVKMVFRIARDAYVENLKEMVAESTGVLTKNLRVFEVYKNKVHKIFGTREMLSMITNNDIIVAHEVLGEEMAGEQVYEILINQRTEVPSQQLSKCSYCSKSCSVTGLKRCLHCLRAAYCNQECQRKDWLSHKPLCRQTPDAVGFPFLLSLPASQATYSRVCRHAETFARYSVNIFQPPLNSAGSSNSTVVEDEDTESLSTSSTSLSSSPDDPNTPPRQASTASATLSSTLSQAAKVLANSQDCEAENGGGGGDEIGSLFGLDDDDEKDIDESDLEEMRRQQEKHDEEMRERNKQQEEKWTRNRQEEEMRSRQQQQLEEEVEAEDKDEVKDSEDSTVIKDGDEEKKTRVVLATQQSVDMPVKQFDLKPSDQYGSTRLYEPLSDLGDEPIPFPRGMSFVFMDWRNGGKRKPMLLVDSKSELDMVEDSSVSENKNRFENTDFTLEQCVELFTEPEKLSREHAWYCPSCKEHREASKQLSIWSLPDMLILHLKRFSYANILFKDKIDKHVSFPIRGLDLGRFMTVEPEEPVLYDLYGVVNHMGSMIHGHYIAYVKEGPGSDTPGWRCCDDSYVHTIPESRVVSKDAYVLFYQRRRKPSEAPIASQLPPTIPTTATEEGEGAEGEEVEGDEAIAEEANTEPTQTVVEELGPGFGREESEGMLAATGSSFPSSFSSSSPSTSFVPSSLSAPSHAVPLSLNLGSCGDVEGLEPITMTVGAGDEGSGDAPYTDMDTVD